MSEDHEGYRDEVNRVLHMLDQEEGVFATTFADLRLAHAFHEILGDKSKEEFLASLGRCGIPVVFLIRRMAMCSLVRAMIQNEREGRYPS